MADDTYDSQGTELFLSLDATTVLAFDCHTGIAGVGFTAEERNSNCLAETIGKNKPGRRTLSPLTIPFRVIRGSEAHQYLLSLTEEGEALVELPYAIGWTDGTADPTISSGAFVAPGTPPNYTRTYTIGTAYVSAVSIDFADGQDVLGSFTLLPQSSQTYWKPVA